MYLNGRKTLLVSLDVKRKCYQKRQQQSSACRQLVVMVILAFSTSAALLSDFSKLLNQGASTGAKAQLVEPAWSSWMGELPAAAEFYGDSNSGIQATDAFDDDDNDEELDTSATNEYPDGNDNDESYEYQDDQDNDESKQKFHWTPASQVGGHAVWADLEGWRRNKRDIEDRIVLNSRRAALKRKDVARGNLPDGFTLDEYADGDEDADEWVHDGIDDIHIDPETKRAANELSLDEKSIDAEYDPNQQPQQQETGVLVNRTKITTIAEVIPVTGVPLSDMQSDVADADSTEQWPTQTATNEHSTLASSRIKLTPTALHQISLPASYLSFDRVQRLLSRSQPQQHRVLGQQA